MKYKQSGLASAQFWSHLHAHFLIQQIFECLVYSEDRGKTGTSCTVQMSTLEPQRVGTI